MRRRHAFWQLGVVALALLVSLAAPAAADQELTLRILHLNDTHSHLDPTPISIDVEGAKTYAEAGGFPRVMAKVRQAREAGGPLLVLHAGDLVQGTLYFQAYKGMADIDFINAMGFDAMTLGNHEFDRGPRFLAGMLRAAKFPVVSANVHADADPDLNGMFVPYIVKEFDGVKVGIVGVTTPDTVTASSPGPTVSFGDPRDDVRKAIAELAEQGVHNIIVLSHLGLPGDILLAQAVDGIDIIVGGHSHSLLGEFGPLGMRPDAPYPVTAAGPSGAPVYVVQAWEWAKVMGDLTVTFDAEGRARLVSSKPALILADTFRRKDAEGKKQPVEGADLEKLRQTLKALPQVEVLADDADGSALLAKYSPGLDALRNTVVAEIKDNLLHMREPGIHQATGQELPRGSLIAPVVAESMLWQLERTGSHADVSLENAGGVRTDLLKGDLTVAQVYELLPFNNTLVTLDITGETFLAALEHGVGKGGGAFPYLAGARYGLDMTKPAGSRITQVEIRQPNGSFAPLDPAANLRLVTNSFVASGGDGYGMFKESKGPRYDTGFVDAEVFMEFAADRKTLTAPEETGVIPR